MSFLFSRAPSAHSPSATEFVLREAKRLHRLATSQSLACALPILRRLLTARAVPAKPLPALFRERSVLQRKHFLRMLALEAGYDSWEHYATQLPELPVESLQDTAALTSEIATLKLWFSSRDQADRYASEHGGHVMVAGTQAVVIDADERRGATHAI